MTPDDVAAYRAAPMGLNQKMTVALCDALTAAWAERDESAEMELSLLATCVELRQRAARAEAELRLVEDHDAGRCAKSLTRIIGEAEAALARVRALCDEPTRCYTSENGVVDVVRVEKIRAVVEGDNQ